MRVVTSPRAIPKIKGTRALVPTMGALHEGHLALVAEAAKHAEQVVVSIFVNPIQFTDKTDLDRYPRTLEQDVALLEAHGAHVVFAPSVETMYPSGDPLVTVAAGAVGDTFEGEFRPGHFDGVLTVVAKLFNVVQPDVALFGQKDAQQVIAISRMVADLNFPVEIKVVPTVRDFDGLALSSRNTFLTPEDRKHALALSAALRLTEAAVDRGLSLSEAIAEGQELLNDSPGVDVEYFAALNPATAAPIADGELADNYRGDVVIAVAAKVGSVRLIDNVPVTIGEAE